MTMTLRPWWRWFEQRRFAAQLETMHSQWFAAEDEGRTEDPTEQKLRKAREDGKVAKSADVTQAIVLLFAVLTLGALGGNLLRIMLDMLRFFLIRIGESDLAISGQLGNAFMSYFTRMVLPIAAVAFLSAIFGNVIQFGFLFSTKPITPDLNRITPKIGKWIQRSFFSAEAAYNFGRSLGKVIILAAMAFVLIRNRFDHLSNLMTVPFGQAFAFVARTVFTLLLQSALVLLFISLFDYLFQRHQHLEQLKMTKQEVKEERRQYEGDPLVRSRLRQRMQELMSRNLVQNVQRADVVVTNPTHFAVALAYDATTMAAPTVVAKGQDEVALRIRSLAREYEIPIIENKPLARALYADVEVGQTISEQFYEAMVIILRQVYRMTGKKVIYG